MARLGIVEPIHLRGLHYALVSSTSLTKPDGERYLNNADDWEWLQVEASKAARWLGYVPFDQIIDERNDAPVIVVHDNGAPEAEIGLGADDRGERPRRSRTSSRPSTSTTSRPGSRTGSSVFGEKTSLADVAEPLCERYRADLYLPSGEITDSQLYPWPRPAPRTAGR